MDNEKKVIFMDFKGKHKVPDGFKVDKEKDKNLIIQKVLSELNEFYAQQKWNDPPGPNCPPYEAIITLANFTGEFFLGKKGPIMYRILKHTEVCERCHAIYYKRLIDKQKQKYKKVNKTSTLSNE